MVNNQTSTPERAFAEEFEARYGHLPLPEAVVARAAELKVLENAQHPTAEAQVAQDSDSQQFNVEKIGGLPTRSTVQVHTSTPDNRQI